MRRISLLSRIKLKQAITFLVLPSLAVLITLGVTTDLFNTKRTAKAVTITSGSSIPASAENQAVIVSGTQILMDNQAVYQENIAGQIKGQACSNIADTNCDTKRRFRSLTLQNGAEITHSQVSARVSSVTLDTTGRDRWRKVDIELEGDLRIESGATMHADGKGYPGGVYAHKDGYGPNGGFGIIEPHEGSIGANGGGYKGKRGRGYCIDNGGGDCVNPYGGGFEGLIPAQSNNNAFDFDLGSGGGHGNQTFNGKFTGADGGAGGGRIRIVTGGDIVITSTTSRISADGVSGLLRNEGGDEKEFSGGGAGGSVLLSASGYRTPAPDSKSGSYGTSADGGFILDNDRKEFINEGSTASPDLNWSQFKYGQGSDGVLINGSSAVVSNIFARGGNSFFRSSSNLDAFGGAGGGGEVNIIFTGSSFNVFKLLEPWARNSESNINFNPYALMIGDEIVVKILVSNLSVGQSATVEDYALSTPNTGTAKCEPINGTQKRNGSIDGTADSSKVSWTFVANSSDEQLEYHCLVK